jgi:hypothetical protein
MGCRRSVERQMSPKPALASRRSFNPVVLEADRHWRREFLERLRMDDPAQGVGRVGFGRVFLELPVPWAWMTAYSSRRNNLCGNTLVLKGDAGAELFQALRSRRRDDGSGQAACYTAAPYGRPRSFRLADLFLIRPHQVAARRRPRTEERLRRQDQGSEGLTNRGP